MRFMVITKRRPGVLKGAPPLTAARHFENVQNYFDGLKIKGLLLEEGRMVGHHSRFQIFQVRSNKELNSLLENAPNAPFVTRDIFQIGSVYETLDKLRVRALGVG